MATKSEIEALALKIEKDDDDGAFYEAEREVGLALGLWRDTGRGTFVCGDEEFVDHRGGVYPSLLESLDVGVAAIGKILPGWEWLKKTPRVITLYRPPAGKDFAVHIDGTGLNDARALCVAMLRAYASTLEA